MPVAVLSEFEKQITAALKNCIKVCYLEVDFEDAIKELFQGMFKKAAKTAWKSGEEGVAHMLREGFLPFCVHGSNTKEQKLANRVKHWSQEWTASTASPLVASPSQVQLPTTASSTAAMNSASSTASTSSKRSLSSVTAASPSKRLRK